MKRFRTEIIRTRAVGALRVLALLVVVQAIAAALWLRSAHARASEALLSVGAELMKVEGANPNQAVRSLFLNGITVHLRTATTDRELHAVLDRFHALCRSRTGVEAPQAVLDKLRKDAKKGASALFLDGVLRAESDSEGAIACIDTGMQLPVVELASRLQEFAKTGDLSAVGDLRYLLARRVDGKTAVLSLWTEGSTPLLKMFPPTGDAPGQDPPGIPRAPGMTRLLSTWENGQPYSMTAYVAAGTKEATLAGFYADALRTAGWVVESKPIPEASSNATDIVARRGSQTAIIHVGNDRRGDAAVSIAVLD